MVDTVTIIHTVNDQWAHSLYYVRTIIIIILEYTEYYLYQHLLLQSPNNFIAVGLKTMWKHCRNIINNAEKYIID